MQKKMKLSTFVYFANIIWFGATSIVDGVPDECPAIGENPKKVGKFS
jgi:hypothetical protein